MGCDVITSKTLCGALVSIHAPAWGATRDTARNKRVITVVSIHAPAWGATNFDWVVSSQLKVSIHAPAWGAT